MKALLVTFCIITGLFGGGCALAAGAIGASANVLQLIPAAVFLFNLLVVIAVLGWASPWKPAFYALAVADYLIAGAVVLSLVLWGAGIGDVLPWAVLLAAAFALKGYLTWGFARKA